MDKSKAGNFYDSLSADYDLMINFNAALEKRSELLSNFIKPSNARAADLGCGSGLDSIVLARFGYKVTGFDISAGMILKAEENAKRNNVEIDFLAASIDKIPGQPGNKYSLILSLGNSLANIDEKHLIKSFSKMFSLLQPGGKVLIQILNYNRILKLKERIVGITEKEDYAFIRFYDFHKDHLGFNILKYDKKNKNNHSIISTEIYPYKSAQMVKMISEAGFKKVKKYGGLNKSKFAPVESADLVIEAFK